MKSFNRTSWWIGRYRARTCDLDDVNVALASSPNAQGPFGKLRGSAERIKSIRESVFYVLCVSVVQMHLHHRDAPRQEETKSNHLFADAPQALGRAHVHSFALEHQRTAKRLQRIAGELLVLAARLKYEVLPLSLLT